MPNKRRPGARGHEIVTDDDLWDAYLVVCAKLGISRTQRLNDRMADDVRRHLPPDQWPPSVRGKKETP